MANPYAELEKQMAGSHQAESQSVANPYAELEKVFANKSKEDKAKLLKELAESKSGFDKFLIATGKGLTDVGRGVQNLFGANKQPDQTEAEAFEALRQTAPFTVGAGEIVGQAAPFVPAALGAAALTASAGAVPTVLGQAAVGGLEGATIAKGTDGDVASAAGTGAIIAGGIEAISPVLGRISRQFYQQLTGQAPKGMLVDPSGRPTPEMQQALQQAGMSWQDLTNQARRAVMAQPQGANPEQVARIAGFEQMGAPYSRGNITQADIDVGSEQRLLGSITDPAAEQYRNLIMNQSQAFEREAQAIADKFNPSGEVTDVGQAVKDALMGRKSQLKAERKELYGKLAEAARNTEGMPIFTDDLLSKVDPDVNFGDIRALAPGAYDALNRVLVEFGVNRSNEALEAAAKAGIKPESIKPLSLSNFESFRKRLNNIVAADRTGAIANIAGPLKQALDEEVDLMAKTLEMSPIEEVAKAAKDARRAHAALKTEFDDKAITAKLTDKAAWGSNEPKVYASQVYQQVMAKSTPIEQTNKLLQSLRNSSDTGKLAINELRGQAVLDLLDSAMKAKSNKINGQLIFNGNAFVQAFTKNEAKIKALFAGDDEAMRRLQNMVARAKDITPSARMTPKGSADVNMDIARNVFRMLGFAGGDMTTIGGAMLGGAMKSSSMKSQAAQAASPKAQKVQYFNEIVIDNYPRLAAGLGIAVAQEDNRSNTSQQQEAQ